MSSRAPADLVVFDLDGTLVDSLDDIAHAANTALQAHRRAPYPVARYRDFVGWGLRRLLELAAPDAGEDQWSELEASFRAHYGVSRTRVYPGIAALVDELAAAGVAVAVLSNKPEEFTVQVVDALFASVPWIAVRGQRSDTPRKPDPAGLIEIGRLARVGAAASVMVGDTDVDLATARAAGVLGIGVTWGFGRGLDPATSVDDVAGLRNKLARADDDLTGR